MVTEALGVEMATRTVRQQVLNSPGSVKAEELENRVELAFCHSQHWGVQPAAGSCVLLDHLFCGFVLIFVLFFSLFYYERGRYYKKERERARKK